jgi:hypothetical protein
VAGAERAGQGSVLSPGTSPGREAAYNFTNCDELGVTICGTPFDLLLFELVLGFSGWRWPTVALSESYEALLLGVQEHSGGWAGL